MQSARSRSAGSLTFAVTVWLALTPVGAHAGELMDAVSPQARITLDRVVRDAVEYDHCRVDWDLGEQDVDAYVELLRETIKELPQYATLDGDGRKVLLLNLLVELQREAMAAPPPDCSVARMGGKRA